jgi:serine/threonine protein kinase/Tol biopolymer transport system component
MSEGASAQPEMTPERWHQVKDLLATVIRLPAEDRSKYMAEVCGSDSALRAELESLLAAHEIAENGVTGKFLEKPALGYLVKAPIAEESAGFHAGSEFLSTATSSETEDPMAGRRLGAYKLVKQIGQGGMAAVFLAVRADDEYQKEVAIKLVQPRSDSHDLLNRFRNERQTLAGLDHPNIVKLLDGGSTPEGLPFLVMDYVEGSAVDDYCDRLKLHIDERLALFSKICEAVQYAHQKGVIHRDLKPSNILVTADGTPKLLDFGIAKVLEPTAGMPLVTQTGTRCMTPAYASPEQVRGKAVTPTTDIYSLGVVLYELLTGHRPYRLKEHTPAEIERAICEQEPETPSTAVSRVESETSSDGSPAIKTPELVSQTREGQPEKLRRRLRGDLDNILLKALCKEPERRYGSVQEFAQEIDRHLSHLPVAARRSSLAYRASKFVRRHKSEVSTVVVTTAIVAIAILAYWVTRPLPPPKVSGYVQVSDDRQQKLGFAGSFSLPLVTDGPRLYLTENENLLFKLAQVSTGGGDTVRIPCPVGDPQLFDISPDKSQLLVGGYTPAEMPLWILPPLGGPPRRLDGLLGHDATWTPDGENIVYANGNELLVVSSREGEPRKLVTLPGPARWLRWSPDGTRLRFTLNDPKSDSNSLWEVAADGTHPHPILTGFNDPPAECCGNWTPDGRYYIFQSTKNNRTHIFAIQEKSGLFRRVMDRPTQLTAGPLNYYAPLPSADGKRLFVVGSQPRGELSRLDSKTQQFAPYLSGSSIIGLDFSRDGEWVAYVTFPEGSLWRSKVDGSQQAQLTFPPMQVFLPRWSPDGKRIAFAATIPGKLESVYLITAEGGQAEQVAKDQNNEDVGWSPDGSQLVFGLAAPFGAAVPTIQLLNLKTHERSTLPGSQGLFSPRWSPDGGYIAAITSDNASLRLYEVATQKWVELAKLPMGYPSWSRDSKYIYFDSGGDSPAFYRVRVSDQKLEQLVRLTNIRRAGNDGWTGLALDDSPLLLRDVGTEEIYALDWLSP